MLKLLKKFTSRPAREEAPSTQTPPRMTLEERKTYRREMLYQAIRECMLRLGALASMYKFRCLSVDERHHHFIVMIAVTSVFEARLAGKSLSHAEIESFIRKFSFERYGVAVDGMYWRIDASSPSFSRERRAGDTPGTPVKTQSPRQRQESQRLARHSFDLASEQDRKRFTQAIKERRLPPPIRVGRQEYVSDLMPIESVLESSGTQYGQL